MNEDKFILTFEDGHKKEVTPEPFFCEKCGQPADVLLLVPKKKALCNAHDTKENRQ
jgi:hypothetical protein